MSDRLTPTQRLGIALAEQKRMGQAAFEARVSRLRKLGHLPVREYRQLRDDEKKSE